MLVNRMMMRFQNSNSSKRCRYRMPVLEKITFDEFESAADKRMVDVCLRAVIEMRSVDSVHEMDG